MPRPLRFQTMLCIARTLACFAHFWWGTVAALDSPPALSPPTLLLIRIKRPKRRSSASSPPLNALTGKSTHPDPRSVIDALARRDSARMIVDGITAANDIGLSDAVPAHIIVHTDARLKSFALGNLTIHFKKTAPSKLFWAGRPAMPVVQALHWLRDTLQSDTPRVRKRLISIFADPAHGSAMTADRQGGLSTLPVWMQSFLRDLIENDVAA